MSASSEGLRVADESGRLAEEGYRGLDRMLTGILESTEFVGQIARTTEDQLVSSQNVVTSIETVASQSKAGGSRGGRTGENGAEHCAKRELR